MYSCVYDYWSNKILSWWLHAGMKIAIFAENMNNSHKQVMNFFCNVTNLHTPYSHKERFPLFLFDTFWKLNYVTFDMSKIIVSNIFNQFLAPNRRTKGGVDH